MISVGITGGIGSGKTSVCQFFERLGVPVYYADDRAKYLMHHNDELKNGIIAAFGAESYTANGELNRPFLAQSVFNDSNQLQKLNSLVHPVVWADTSAWMQSNAAKPYVLYEAAILFESGSYKMLDKVITVFTPEDVRLKRVMTRDRISADEVKQRMNKQLPEEEKIAKSDYVIYNDGSQMLVSQILELNKELKSLG